MTFSQGNPGDSPQIRANILRGIPTSVATCSPQAQQQLPQVPVCLPDDHWRPGAKRALCKYGKPRSNRLGLLSHASAQALDFFKTFDAARETRSWRTIKVSSPLSPMWGCSKGAGSTTSVEKFQLQEWNGTGRSMRLLGQGRIAPHISAVCFESTLHLGWLIPVKSTR